MAPPDQPRSPAGKVGEVVANLIRGFLIGLAELVPGISGGTVALVVGIYERALDAGMSLIDAAKSLFSDRSAVGAKVRAIDWWLLVPVGISMVAAVFSMSGVMHAFVTDHAQVARALFLGMVAMSIVVPLQMVYKPDLAAKPWVWVIFAAAAVATFFATGFTAAPVEDPPLVAIFFAAMFAVIALIMPGVSGSFLLLALGLYAPVMGSVSNREWDVIGVFILGALIGIVLFVRVMSWLLAKHRTVTLVTMAGLMLGSLRALWPWQDNDATLLAPESAGDLFTSLGWVLLGAAIVGLTLIAERRLSHRSGARVEEEQAPA